MSNHKPPPPFVPGETRVIGGVSYTRATIRGKNSEDVYAAVADALRRIDGREPSINPPCCRCFTYAADVSDYYSCEDQCGSRHIDRSTTGALIVRTEDVPLLALEGVL